METGRIVLVAKYIHDNNKQRSLRAVMPRTLFHLESNETSRLRPNGSVSSAFNGLNYFQPPTTTESNSRPTEGWLIDGN